MTDSMRVGTPNFLHCAVTEAIEYSGYCKQTIGVYHKFTTQCTAIIKAMATGWCDKKMISLNDSDTVAGSRLTRYR